MWHLASRVFGHVGVWSFRHPHEDHHIWTTPSVVAVLLGPTRIKNNRNVIPLPTMSRKLRHAMQGVRAFASAFVLPRNGGILLRRQWFLVLVVLLLLRPTFLVFVSDVVCVCSSLIVPARQTTFVFGRAHDDGLEVLVGTFRISC